MESLVHTLSKMFLVVVLLFGNPPVANLRDRARRPVIALVMPLRRRGEGELPTGSGSDETQQWPEPWPPCAKLSRVQGHTDTAERVYILVRAA